MGSASSSFAQNGGSPFVSNIGSSFTRRKDETANQCGHLGHHPFQLASLPDPGNISADREIALKLGGQYCNFFLDDVKKALMKVTGVFDVSFDQSGGTAIVTGDPGKMKSGLLIRALRGVHGDAWNCDAKKAN